MDVPARTSRRGKWLVVVISLILCISMGTTQALAAAYASYNNNFTMIDGAGGLTGGTNNVYFAWDGTLKTAVAASGQVSNATISNCVPVCWFFGVTWLAHDVAIYGPGTYTVYAGCAPGSPGCGTGTAITFTVGAGEMGGHLLFDWGGNNDIDVVNVWTTNAVFAPSPLHTGECGSNAADKVWDWMSKDVDGDGKNGYPMVDGPFFSFNANFNWMAVVDPCDGCDDHNICTDDTCNATTHLCEHINNTIGCNADNSACTDNDTCSEGVCVAGAMLNCDDQLACSEDSCAPAIGCVHSYFCPITVLPTLVSPLDGATGLGTTVELRWMKFSDEDGDPIKYHIYYCTTQNTEGCAVVATVDDKTAVKRDNKGVFYAGGAGLLMVGMTFISGLTGRKRTILLLVCIVLFAAGALTACSSHHSDSSSLPPDQMNYMASGLSANTTYYWKIEADDERGGIASSTVWSFTTQQ